jgi:hypothetical protein
MCIQIVGESPMIENMQVMLLGGTSTSFFERSVVNLLFGPTPCGSRCE